MTLLNKNLLRGRYRIGEVLAPDDGMGAYYAARDEFLGRAVTIKYVDVQETDRTLRRFEREARILGAIRHPAVLKLFESGLRDDPPFLVFEAINGTTLPDWLTQFKERPLSVRDACAIGLDLADVLGMAHARGFVHRRVLPEYVFMTSIGQPKLLGFGRASLATSRGTTTSEVLSQVNPFLAPEVLFSDTKDARTDLYGVAAVLYYLVTGQPPINITNLSTPDAIQELATTRRTPVRSYREDVSELLEGFLMTALSIDPEDRYQSASEFCDALRLADSDRPSAAIGADVGLRAGVVVGGRYVMEALLGRGSAGSVFLALDRQLDRQVAIKFIKYGDNNLLLEARAMAQVSHANLVQVYDVGRHDGLGYIVMENVPGMSVEDRMADTPLPRAEALTILDQLCRGLDALHRADLVHADVKPSNILLGSAYRVCLADFGLVRTRETWSDPECSLGGTPAYFAPERMRRTITRPQAHLIDIYSLGVVAFELLSGELPFSAPNPLALLRLHVSAVPPRLSSLGPSLEAFDDLIASTLAKDPSARPQSAEEFRQALFKAQARSSRPDGFCVLVVDDDPASQQLFGAHLEEILPGVELGFVATGEEAIAAIETKRPSLVILDLALDGMNGIEVAATVRSDIDNPPPIVVVTGRGSAADWQVLSSLGVAAFLFKPLDAELFELTVRRVIG